MTNKLHAVVSIHNRHHNRTYLTVTSRNPKHFLIRLLTLVRQGWDGQHYLRARGPSLLIQDLEEQDAEHRRALARDQREGQLPIQGWTIEILETFHDRNAALNRCEELIRFWETWKATIGYNQASTPKAQTVIPRGPVTLPMWETDMGGATEGSVTIRVGEAEDRSGAQVTSDGQTLSVEWPPHPHKRMELEYD